MVKRKNAAAPTEAASKWQWLTKPWAVVVAVGAVLGAFLLNINSVLTNVRNLPSEVRKTTDAFSSWYYDDASWSGYWTSEPQGYVDGEDMNLSRTRVGLQLVVKHGEIEGMVSTQAVCDSVPMFDYLLISGNVDAFGDAATVMVWDIFQGHKANVAKLRLRRKGVLMELSPKEGMTKLFPEARIARDPNDNSWPSEFCPGKREAMLNALKQITAGERAKR